MFGGVWVAVKFVFIFRCVVRLPASWEGIAPRTASLLLRFVGAWVDVKFVFVQGCVAWLPASWEARLGRRISDCVVASKVWGCLGGCYNLFSLRLRCAVACVVGSSFRASRLGLRRCF